MKLQKMFLIMILMILSLQLDLLAQKPLVISELKIDCQNIMVSKKIFNEIYFLGTIPNQSGKSQYMTLKKYSNGKIIDIPLNIEINGNLEQFKVSAREVLSYDSKGNLYLLGDGIYKYDGNSWSVYRISDEFEKFRDYINIVVSNDDNLWFITQVREEIGNMVGEYHTKLYRKSNKNLDIVYEEKWGATVFDKLYALENGKVVVQKLYNKNNPYDSKKYNFDSTLYDLWIYDENLNIIYDRIHTPSGEPFNNMNKRISSLTSNENGDLLISLKGKQYSTNILGTKYNTCCGGYTEKIDMKWQKYDTTYNFKFNNNMYIDFNTHYMLVEKKILLFQNSEWAVTKPKIFNKSEKSVIDLISKDYYENSYVITAINWNNFSLLTEDLDIYCHSIIELEGSLWFINQHFITVIPKYNFNKIMNIEEDVTYHNLLIFPNPVLDELFIDDKNDLNITDYKIYDTSGKLLIKNKFKSKFISVSNLLTGVYFIELIDKQNTILKSAKFIKE